MEASQEFKQKRVIKVLLDYHDMGYAPRAKQVKAEVERQLKDEGYENVEIALRTVQLYIQETKDELRRRSLAEKIDVDGPWSMGSLANYDIPLETIPAVLRVWRCRLATGAPFSIRDARWVARLHGITSDTVALDGWTRLYSQQDRTSAMLKVPFDSSSLDVSLLIGTWQLATARFTGKIKVVEIWPRFATAPIPPHLRLRPFSSKSVAQIAESELAWRLMLEDRHLDAQTGLDRLRTQVGLLAQDTLWNATLSEEAEWVYAYWLIYLCAGAKWQGLSIENRVETIMRLREWVQNHPWTVKPETICDMDYEELITQPEFMPTELLRQGGYDI